MKINCKRCGTHLGDIKPGSVLKKGTVFLCGDCNDIYKLADSMVQSRQSNFDPFFHDFPPWAGP